MDIVEQLTRALPAGTVITDPVALDACRTDRSGHLSCGRPLALVEARSIEDVQEVCRIATATNTPVVSRGAGTGLAGGGIAGTGEIVLSTLHMNRILEVSTANQLAVVEPGIINGEMNRALFEHGMWWAPDPASKDIATVGGNIAMNAGGLLCAKYGVTREAVLALKVVLADGRLISVGHRTVKGVTGYDLCALMIGSEGTLGVIVEATLKLRPLVTGNVATIAAYLDSVETGASIAARISAAGLQPAIMELLDRRSLECLDAYTGGSLLSRGNAYLLIQCDGAAAEAEAAAMLAIIREAGAQAETTTDPVLADEWVHVRRQVFPSLEAQGTLLVEDVAVPREQMPAMFAKLAQLEEKYGISIPSSAHAGDGNLHPCFIFQGEDVPQMIWDAAGEMFAHALELGGTLTGEHGIGVLKKRWLGDELGDVQLMLQRQIKAVFDPAGLLNPGKVLDPLVQGAPAVC
ncbi:FAD-binding oxidoreductase [Paeniglutamicibacter cryotolerans]|uniref:Glycolate oxidase n=1 Tax=Paeniglutamicibacter cryotolerans TaxID=670079 RepID=A0A839QNA4_9MICC|nr:FAD-linked oxidase C-terminal domain-containing protein [Paeniglutamicibacter cryotolerans]MBB2996105.1 glycolate oxidase [Paeniglutamicibacter cryotolerans]